VVENSFVGPYTSVGDNSRIVSSNVEYSVILENALVQDVDRLEESLIGKNAVVCKNRKTKAIKLHVGDYSEVEI
jgi:glucose-1-phosphate thymidylyltransferase